jgi:nucleoside-diphosphate-sugar epimerase
MLALSSKNAAGEVFNIGISKGISVDKVAELTNDLMNKKSIKSTYSNLDQPIFDTATPT